MLDLSMPHYYFDISFELDTVLDSEGMVLADFPAVRLEACALMMELSQDQQRKGRSSNIAVTVRDAARLPVASGKLTLEVRLL